MTVIRLVSQDTVKLKRYENAKPKKSTLSIIPTHKTWLNFSTILKKRRRKEEQFQYFHATDVKMWPLMGFRYMAAIIHGLIKNDCHSHCS